MDIDIEKLKKLCQEKAHNNFGYRRLIYLDEVEAIINEMAQEEIAKDFFKMAKDRKYKTIREAYKDIIKVGFKGTFEDYIQYIESQKVEK